MRRAPLIAALAAAASVAPGAGSAVAAEPSAAPPPGLGTALVARSLEVPAAPGRSPAAAPRATRLLQRTLRADGYDAVRVSCRTAGVRAARCRIASARRAGATWSGGAGVTAGRRVATIRYTLESPSGA